MIPKVGAMSAPLPLPWGKLQPPPCAGQAAAQPAPTRGSFKALPHLCSVPGIRTHAPPELKPNWAPQAAVVALMDGAVCCIHTVAHTLLLSLAPPG